MTYPDILLPLFVEVGLTFILLLWGGVTRVSLVGRGRVRTDDVALGQPAWPRQPTLIMNSYHNQFELPVLFYVLVILALLTKKADFLFVVMSWIFVLTRILHAGLHATTNDMRLRFSIFLAGAVVLMLMWIIFALRILLAAPLF